jgi:urease accessory protein
MNAVAPPRHDPAWYTPAGLPEELTGYAGAIHGGPTVGAAGKVGLLELELASCGGVTRVRRRYHRAPLHLYRPIYLDAGRPDMAFLFLQQSGDGLVQGDRYRIDIDCGPGSAAHITTQAATNVYGAREDYVTQLVNLNVDAGAVVEYLPDPVVPFRGARLFQRTCVTTDPSATVILGDILLPGRVAHGEAHVYDLIHSETRVRRPDTSLQFADALQFNPAAGEDLRSLGVLGHHDVVATLHVVTGRMAPPMLVSLLRDVLGECPGVVAGASELPNGCGAIVRILGSGSGAVKASMRTAWNAARVALLGVPAPDLRKG